MVDSAVNYSRVTPIGLAMDSLEVDERHEKQRVMSGQKISNPNQKAQKQFKSLDNNRSAGSLEHELQTLQINGVRKFSTDA